MSDKWVMGRTIARTGYFSAIVGAGTIVRRTWRYVNGLVSRLTLVQRFALVSLVILIFGALIIGRYVGEEIEDGVVANSSTITALYVDSFISPLLQELDNGAASDFIVDQLEDFLRLEGEEIGSGFILEEVETFAVGGPGSDAVGLRLRASFGDARVYGTTLSFKLDRLVGSVTLNRADDTNVDSQVEEIARALEKRIEGVLLGDITGTPVPIPVEEEEGA